MNDSLIDAARSVLGEFPLAKDLYAGSVGAALRTAGGNIYTGICIDLASGLGFCAEVSAMAEMLKNRETQIAEIVAVSKFGVIPPCGRCRETMMQVDFRNLETNVIVGEGEAVKLKELLPKPWMIPEDSKDEI
jgi:cytidine deaminase